MLRHPPKYTRHVTPFSYTNLFRSIMKQRVFIAGSISVACAVLLGVSACSPAEAPPAGPANTGCDNPTEVQGFLTCADVEAAKEEGTVVLYAPAGEIGRAPV